MRKYLSLHSLSLMCVCITLFALALLVSVFLSAAFLWVSPSTGLFVGDDDLLIIDHLLDGSGTVSVDGAADGKASAEDFLHGARQLSSEGLESHLSGNVHDLIQGDVAIVLDELGRLLVSHGLVQSSQNEGRSGRENDHGRLKERRKKGKRRGKEKEKRE